MNWNFLKENIYFSDGSWRDIYIKNVTAEDWSKWVDFVNQKYRIDWRNEKTEKDEVQIDFDVIRQFWKGEDELCSTAKVFLEDLQINAHFFDDKEIENDIDPDEFNSIEDHNRLMEYLKSISNLLQKEVIVTLEDYPEYILIKVNDELVEIPTDINPPKWPTPLKQ